MAMVRTGREPFCGLICQTTEVPPPKGMTIRSCSLASVNKVSTSAVDSGKATPSGNTSKSPLCMAIQSGKLCPRACLSLTSLSIDTVASLVIAAGRRDFGTVLSTCCKLTEDSFLVLPICDLISFAPCGETFLLILILPQPFQRVCSIGVLADVLLDASVGMLSFAGVSKALLSASLMVSAVGVDFL